MTIFGPMREVAAIVSRAHAGRLVDPAELAGASVIGSLVSEAAASFLHVLRQAVSGTPPPLAGILYCSFHPDQDLVLLWRDVLAAATDPRAYAVRVHGASGTLLSAGLDWAFHDWGEKVSGLLVRSAGAGARGRLLLHSGSAKDLSGSAPSDFSLFDAFDSGDRLYLPVYLRRRPRRAAPSVPDGVFVIPIGGPARTLAFDDLWDRVAKPVIDHHSNWTETRPRDRALLVLSHVDDLWALTWKSCRESRTLLPDRESFRRVVDAVFRPEFAGAASVVGLVHFDVDDFKSFNTALKYDGADRVIESFVRHLVERIAQALASGYDQPILTAPGAWTTLQAPSAVGWYLSRLGGDEFGLAYIARQSRAALFTHAVAGAAAATNAEVCADVGSALTFRCTGARLELGTSDLAQIDASGPPSATPIGERLWRFVTDRSQEVKAALKDDASASNILPVDPGPATRAAAT